MRKWMYRVGGVIAGGCVLALSLAVAGEQLNKRRIDSEVDRLLAASQPVDSEIIRDEDLAALPEPVQRWLRWSGVVGRTRVATVTVNQTGEFRLSEDQDWMPYTAVQHYTVNPPGFIWSVSMEMFPFIDVTGRDMYEDGEGSIDMRLMSLVPVARKSGGDLNQGAALRYLNEIMFFPTAALSPQIAWTPINANSARATFTHKEISVEAEFVFDGEGRLVTMTAMRYNDEKEEILPWSTPIEAYGEFDGVRMPVEGSGVWEYPEGPFEYIRLTITSVEFDPDTEN